MAPNIKSNIISGYFREILLTLVIVFAFTTVILLLAGAPPFKAYYQIF